MKGRVARALLLAAALGLWGCGSPELWARYQAEREFWHARRLVDRIQVRPNLAKPEDYERAIAAFRAVVDRFPAREWATPQRLANPLARDVATLSGDAMLAVGRLEESRGAVTRALEIYQQGVRDYGALPPMRLKALLATATGLERSAGPAAATPIYAEIAGSFPPVDAESGAPIRPALDAPLRVASELRTRGLGTTADSVLRVAESRFAEEAERRSGQAAAPELWSRVARVRAALGGAEQLGPALDAMRRALADPSSGPSRASLVLTMAEYCLQAGRADSALAYTAWAGRDFGREIRGQAMLFEGRVWEAMNQDSAIAAYGRFLDAFPRAGDPALMARFRRAELLEDHGRWEQARADFRALSASSAVHELALQASERIVGHHVRLKEREMARIEARRALEHLDRLLISVQDEESLMRIRQTRSRLLLAVENWSEAFTALADLWSRYGQLPLGSSAAFRAAEVAEQQLRDPDRAVDLYQQLASRAPAPRDQEAARRELDRLRGGSHQP